MSLLTCFQQCVIFACPVGNCEASKYRKSKDKDVSGGVHICVLHREIDTLGLQLPTSVDYCCVHEMYADVNTACSSRPSSGQQPWCCWNISDPAAPSDSKPCPSQGLFCSLAPLGTSPYLHPRNCQHKRFHLLQCGYIWLSLVKTWLETKVPFPRDEMTLLPADWKPPLPW